MFVYVCHYQRVHGSPTSPAPVARPPGGMGDHVELLNIAQEIGSFPIKIVMFCSFPIKMCDFPINYVNVYQGVQMVIFQFELLVYQRIMIDVHPHM